MTKLTKPTPTVETRQYIDFTEACKWIREKHGIDIYDVKGYRLHGEHYKSHLIDVPMIDGKTCTEAEAVAQEVLVEAWYERFNKWQETNPTPEYCNFWHKINDTINKGTICHFGPDNYYASASYVGKHSDQGKDMKWVGEVYQLFLDEFKEYADPDGAIPFYFDW